MKSKELREQRQKLINSIQQMVISARKEERSLNTEEQATFDKLDAEQTRLKHEIDGYERIDRWDSVQLEDAGHFVPAFSTGTRANYGNAVRAALTRGTNLFDPKWEADAQAFGLTGNGIKCEFRNSLPQTVQECRAMASNSSTHGPELVTTTLADAIYEKTLAHGGLLNHAYKFNTVDGSPFYLPTTDNTTLVGALVAQGADDNTADITFSGVTFGSYTISSGIQLISNEMVRDSAKFNIVGWVGEKLGEAVGRKISAYLVTGTGSSQPTGINASSGGLATGKTAASASVVTYAELLDMVYSVDASYRENGKWVIGDGFRKLVQSMLDDNLRPIWQENAMSGFANGAPATLLGYPVHVDYNIPAIATATKVAAFGDFNKAQHVRLVGGLEVASSTERYFEKRSIGVVSYLSIDSKIVNTAAAKVFVMG